MSKYFPLLNQTTVRIEMAHGKVLNCPMLPVSALPEFGNISQALSAAENEQDFEAVRVRMIALVKTVIPPEHQGMLDRFPVETLAELLAYLMYGDGDSEPKDNAEKN